MYHTIHWMRYGLRSVVNFHFHQGAPIIWIHYHLGTRSIYKCPTGFGHEFKFRYPEKNQSVCPNIVVVLKVGYQPSNQPALAISSASPSQFFRFALRPESSVANLQQIKISNSSYVATKQIATDLKHSSSLHRCLSSMTVNVLRLSFAAAAEGV